MEMAYRRRCADSKTVGSVSRDGRFVSIRRHNHCENVLAPTEKNLRRRFLPAALVRGSLILPFVVVSLAGCASALRDDTIDVQKAVDAGGTVTFPAGTYVFTQTVVVNKSNTVIQGVGPETVFVFQPSLPQVHCANDRAFTTPCDVLLTPRRQITGPIAIGATAFAASGDVSDLRSGDWLIIEEKDQTAGDVVVVDWAQVASASGNIVEVQTPFRTPFPNVRVWDSEKSGLGFYKVPQLTENVQSKLYYSCA
jgi:hypothetical protein